MAARKLLRYLSLAWDRDAARRVQQEAEEALARAGKLGGEEFEKAMAAGGRRGGRALTTTLEREYRTRMGRARQQLAEGLIDERAFEREGREAAIAFNRGLSGGIQQLKRTGAGLTDLELANLTGRYKKAPGTGAAAGGMLAAARGMLGPLAGIFGAGAAFSEANESIAAADRYEAAVRKLGGTAKLSGVDLEFLQDAARDAGERFKLATPLANDLTSEVVKLTQKSGDISQTGAAMEAFLDLGAARGLTAAQTLTAVGQAVLGIDEGTDKLFGKNPSVLYEEYAARIGTTAAKLTDQEKSQALLDAALRAGERTRGEYLKYLQGAAGQAEQNRQKVEEMRAAMGRSLQPVRELGGALKVGLYANLLAVSVVLGKIVEYTGKTYRFTLEAITSPGEVWRRLWSDDSAPRLAGADRGEASRRAAAAVAAGTAVDARGRPYRTPAQREQERRDAEARAAVEAREREEKAEKDAAAAAKKAAEARKKEIEDRRKAWKETLRESREANAAELEALERGGSRVFTNTWSAGEWDSQASIDAWLNRSDAKIEALSEMGEWVTRLAEDEQELAEVSARAAYEMSAAFQDAFATMIEDGINVGNFFEALGHGIAGSIMQALAEVAMVEAAKSFADAIKASAEALGFASHGNVASASAAWASAAKHVAAGMAYSALGGMAAASRGAITGGRGAIAGPTYDVGVGITRDADRRGAEIHIYVDGINPGNPDHQRRTYAALQQARERFGEDSHVTVHPNAGRG